MKTEPVCMFIKRLGYTGLKPAAMCGIPYNLAIDADINNAITKAQKRKISCNMNITEYRTRKYAK